MANKAISELPQAQNVNNQDLFVLEQSGIAKKLTAETFITEQGIIDALAEALDGHGGIQSVTLASVSGRIRTYRITFTDQSATTFQVYDGTSIDRISRTSSSGLDDVYTIFLSDGTTTFFTVHNGADGTVSEAMLNDALKDKAPAITETTESSAIANFSDGADDMPLHNILAEINPVQDLNGYDAPWPAGGGKNKLKITANTSTHNGVTMTVNRDTYGNVFSVSLNGTATAMYDFQLFDVATESFVLDNATYYLLPAPSNVKLYLTISNNSATRYIDALSAGTKSFTITDGDVIVAAFIRVESGATLNNLVVYPEIASENTSTFAPYSNICPITGWTGCNVTRTGKNLFDKNAVSTGKWLSTTTGLEENVTGYVVSDYIPVEANKPIYIPATSSVRRWFYDTNKNPKTFLSNSLAQVYTPSENGYIRVTIDVGYQSVDLNSFQIEYGTSASQYEEFNGETASLSWQTEAGTVYGGTIDVATGLLTVTMAMADLGTLNWQYETSTTYPYFWAYGFTTYCKIPQDNNTLAHIVCSQYETITANSGYSGAKTIGICINTSPRLIVYDPRFTDKATFVAAVSGVQLVYELAAPQTYQLTPQEVIKTLLGTNNVWADIGNVSVTYPADTKMFIEKLTMPTEDDLVANQAITSGKYFMIGNSLYLALANIASGAQITIGTNAQRVSLADALNTINS